jgi:uncharacterized membrane protein YgaE (UPF0421/DUF939 family)
MRLTEARCLLDGRSQSVVAALLIILLLILLFGGLGIFVAKVFLLGLLLALLVGAVMGFSGRRRTHV